MLAHTMDREVPSDGPAVQVPEVKRIRLEASLLYICIICSQISRCITTFVCVLSHMDALTSVVDPQLQAGAGLLCR